MLMGLMMAFMFLVLAINLAQLSLQRTEIQSGADATTVSVGSALQDVRWLYQGPEIESPTDEQIAARQELIQQKAAAQFLLLQQLAMQYASMNEVAGEPIVLDAGDINIGWVADPTDRNAAMTVDPSGSFNAISIQISRSKSGGNPPLLWMAQQSGLDGIDIRVQSSATVDNRVIGLQPLESTNIPWMPLCVFPNIEDVEFDAMCNSAGGDAYANIWWGRGPVDEAAVNPDLGLVDSEPGAADDIAEFVLRIPTTEPVGGGTPSDVKKREAALVGFTIGQLDLGMPSDGSVTPFDRICSLGAHAQDLQNFGGLLRLDDGAPQPAVLPAKFSLSPEELQHVCEILSNPAVRGKPRIWPVACKVSSTPGDEQAGVVGLVAGCVVKCEVDGDGALLVYVQPCLIRTPTALNGVATQRNPWLGKLLIYR